MSDIPDRDEYPGLDHFERLARQGLHRQAVGGLWDTLGDLQLAFLKGHGLRPAHRLIDIGCGAFRAGVKLAAYLDPGNYYGVDASAELVAAGYDKEIAAAGLASRLPRDNVKITADFELDAFATKFDYGIAQSVFSHMPLARLAICLEKTAPRFEKGALLFVTFFEAPAAEYDRPLRHRNGVTSHPDRNPFHFRMADVESIAAQSPWRVEHVGDWGHPRDQKMLKFQKQ